MCHIFSRQSPEAYAYQTRSVRLGGHSTSIRLEAAFWSILEEIAAAENVSVAKFLTTLHDEVLELGTDQATNFTSLLRCSCLTYVSEVRGNLLAENRLAMEAKRRSEDYLRNAVTIGTV